MEIKTCKRLYNKFKHNKQINHNKKSLIAFIQYNQNSWLINYLDWYDNEHCLFARKVFTMLAEMCGYEPDTFSGDRFLREIYNSINWNIDIDYEDFNLFMWSVLT